MKFLILKTDYPQFLSWFYRQHTISEQRSYDELMRAQLDWTDPYSANLQELGHQAHTIHANDEFMQKAWAREHGESIGGTAKFVQRLGERLAQIRTRAAGTGLMHLQPVFRPLLDSLDRRVEPWFYKILEAQIKHYQPDVLLNQAVHTIRSRFLRDVKPHVRLLIGQIASPLPKLEDFSCYDLILSSLPSFVEYFGQLGVPSQLHRWAFDTRILSQLKNDSEEIPVSFVGSVTWYHKERVKLLKHLCFDISSLEVWGQGGNDLPEDSPIRRHYRGTAWGLGMFQTLQRSKMTVNEHGDIAGPYASNKRLFEATGVGTLLITDWKLNLHEIFEPGEEVVAYHSPQECVRWVRYYLEHDDERQAIARAGQQRTLREHTYFHRAQELADTAKRHLE